MCLRLVEELNAIGVRAKYHKHLRSPDEFKAMLSILVNGGYDTTLPGEIVVVDRLIWTEWVMGIYTGREEARELTENALLLDRIVLDRQIPHVILHVSERILQDRLARRSEEERRQVDMPWELIRPLWMSAYGMSKSVILMQNELPHHQELIIRTLMARLNIVSKSSSLAG